MGMMIYAQMKSKYTSGPSFYLKSGFSTLIKNHFQNDFNPNKEGLSTVTPILAVLNSIYKLHSENIPSILAIYEILTLHVANILTKNHS